MTQPKQPIGKCGHPVSRDGVARCRQCWKDRGADNPEPRVYMGECGHQVSDSRHRHCKACSPKLHTREAIFPQIADVDLHEAVRRALKTGSRRLEDLAQLIQRTPGQTLDAMISMRDQGLNVHELDGLWSLERTVPQRAAAERSFEYRSRQDNTYVVGVISDNHLCSRYAREDVLDDLYNIFEQRSVDRVVNAGNWIDGEDDKNRFDLSVHGLEPQVDYLVSRYPRRGNIVTYAVWGEDHEGWYSRRESVDMGRFTERKMREAKRDDWVDLGFIEAKIDLINANTGAASSLVVMHPGGGSSYAYSYRSQKIVESLSGGEKPGVLVIGHYHKLNCNTIRNVWTIQAGTTMDQSVFMRKHGLEAHVGGMVITLEQDPDTGAIFRCVADQVIYYDRRYYNDRWSKTRPVVQADRFLGGVKPVGSA